MSPRLLSRSVVALCIGSCVISPVAVDIMARIKKII